MKLFIKLFVGVLTLFILAAILLFILVDPNNYKEEIQVQVKKAINRDLLINGELGWTFYPQLGFSSGEIELLNPNGFNRKNLAKINDAAVSLALMPLFKGEIEIGELTLNGLRFNLITNKNGVSNLDNMIPKQADNKTITKENNNTGSTDGITNEPMTLDTIKLAGININDAIIEVQDLAVGSKTEVNIEQIKLGRFELGKASDLSIITNIVIDKISGRAELQTQLFVAPDLSTVQLKDLNVETLFTGETLPNKKVSSKIQSNIAYTIATNKADLTDFTLAVDDITLQGKLSVQSAAVTKVRFDLQSNEWDLTPYLPAKSETKEASGTVQTAPPTPEEEPNLAFLNTLDVNGALSIAGIKANDIKIGKIDMKVLVNKGKAEIKPLTAQLYEGKLTLNAVIDDAKGANKYNISTALNDVVIRQLLIDAAQIDFLSGKTAFNFTGSGTGLTSSKIKSGLVGKGDFALLDGEIYGVNVPQEIRILKAKIKGKELPTEKNVKKTDFASLTGNFTIQKGQVDNQKLLMLSPVMRLDGAGLADILKESLDYKLSISPLSKSDEKTEVYDLNGITIPMLIKGTFAEPKFSLDIDGALNEQLKAKRKELENKAKDKLKEQQDKSSDELKEEGKKIENKLKGELGKLFG